MAVKNIWRHTVLLIALIVCIAAGGVSAKGAAGTAAQKAKSTATKKTTGTAAKKNTSASAKKKNGFVTKNGRTYYYRNGTLLTGKKKIDGKCYYFYTKNVHGKKKGEMGLGWINIGKARYYFYKSGKKKGQAALGWVTSGKKTCYFQPDGAKIGQLCTGWKTIGKYTYYFDKKTGELVRNQKVGKYYTDNKGRRKKAPASKKTDQTYIFVGDSRTIGMQWCVGSSGNHIYIAASCEGYAWFKSSALPTLKAALGKKPNASVVMNLGINDIKNSAQYIAAYKALQSEYPKAKIYFMSINPVDSKYRGIEYNYNQMSDHIKSFNRSLKKAFPDRFLDTYSFLIKKGFQTIDGLHYTSSTYRNIYDYVLKYI